MSDGTNTPEQVFRHLTAEAMLETVVKSADAHASAHDGDTEYANGDLIDSLAAALRLLTQEQREAFAEARADDVGAWL